MRQHGGIKERERCSDMRASERKRKRERERTQDSAGWINVPMSVTVKDFPLNNDQSYFKGM